MRSFAIMKTFDLSVTLAGLLIGASRFGTQQSQISNKFPIALFIVTLGVIGILISAKYSERADRHAVISRAFRQAMSKLIGDFLGGDLEATHQNAATEHARDRSITGLLYGIRTRYFWLAVHGCVVFLGILVAFV